MIPGAVSSVDGSESGEDTLRDVLVISGNAALSAALVAHDLNVIPVDPVETPGWADRAAAAHLLVLDLGDADRAVDALARLRSQAVDTPALVVAESVTDSPRLVSLRLADQNVKTLSWPLTPERLVRAVERAMSSNSSDEPVLDEPVAAAAPSGPAPTPQPAPPAQASTDRAGVQWPTFERDSFEQSASLDWRTAFTEGLEAPAVQTYPTQSSPTQSTPVPQQPVAPPAVVNRTYSPPPAPAPEPQRPAPAPEPAPAPTPYAAPPATAHVAPTPTPAPTPAPQPQPQPQQKIISIGENYDLPPIPGDENRKHRLAPWARPRPGATAGRFEASAAQAPAAPQTPAAPQAEAPQAVAPQAIAPQAAAPQAYAPPPTAAPTQSPAAQPPSAQPYPYPHQPAPAPASGRQERAAARAAEKARAAAEKMQAKAWAQAERDAAKARNAAEKAAAQSYSTPQPYEAPQAYQAPQVYEAVQPTPAAPAQRPDEVEGVRLLPPAPMSKAEIKAAERAAREKAQADAKAAAEFERATRAQAAAEAKAAAVAERAARPQAEVDAKQAARLAAEAKAAERAAADAVRAQKELAEAQAKAAAESARLAETDQKNRARIDAEAAKAAERAAAIAAKAAAEKAAADAKAAIESEKAIQKARVEAARIAEAQARAQEKAAKQQAEADARLAQEHARAMGKATTEAAREEARLRGIAEREAAAQAKIDSKLAEEAAKAARAQAEQEAEEAAARAKEEAERNREAARIAAEAARVQTIAKVEEAAQHTKIRAEADKIVGEAVRKAEEDFTARALANRPVYYGPELEPPGIGYVHQIMQMTESLASPAQIAEELAFVAMDHMACEAVAVMIPDGDCWVTASGIGVVRGDLRYRLSEEHWFIRHVLGEDEIVLIEDTEALRDELSGVPLSGWQYLVGLPLTDANSIIVGARSDEPFDGEAIAEFTERLSEYIADLAESLSTRDVARQIHERGGG